MRSFSEGRATEWWATASWATDFGAVIARCWWGAEACGATASWATDFAAVITMCSLGGPTAWGAVSWGLPRGGLHWAGLRISERWWQGTSKTNLQIPYSKAV